MAIAAGEKIPSVKVTIMSDKGPSPVSADELLGSGKVVLFSVPGAFTPTCSKAHLPGFVALADQILAKGVASIVCMSVNDVFVMDAWGKSQNVENYITMMADGNGDFSRALGLEMDGTGFGMGKRSQRFAMIIDNGTVIGVYVESGPKLDVSSAESILAAL